jgi:hypothetical protein
MSPTRRIAAIVALGALALSACSSNDADRGDVVEALVDADISQDEADCVGDGFDAEFDQGTMNDLASASTPDDFPEGTGETVTSIIDECIGGGDGPTVGSDEGSDEGSDTTEGSTEDTTDGTTDATTGEADADTTATTEG